MKYQSIYLFEPSLFALISKDGRLETLSKPDLLIIPNSKESIAQVRGRSIDSVFMYGITRREEIDQELAFSISMAQQTAMLSGRPTEYLQRELKGEQT